MQKKMITKCLSSVTLLTLTASFLTGCASYSAAPLNKLSAEVIQKPKNEQAQEISIVAKAFNQADCKYYLDRDVIKKGYQPVQIYLQNDSDKSYLFSLSRVSLPCARSQEVADKVHTSTVGRVVGYGVAAWFTFGLLAIPAVVDGIKSANANEALDCDFAAKTARDQLIPPYSHANALLFVPTSQYQSNFTMTLIDQATNEPKVVQVAIH